MERYRHAATIDTTHADVTLEAWDVLGGGCCLRGEYITGRADAVHARPEGAAEKTFQVFRLEPRVFGPAKNFALVVIGLACLLSGRP